jgi:adenylyltransferase/sulfurtransferase
LNENNALQLLESHDVLVDGTDNIPSRYTINDACKKLGIPWVYGSIYRFEGQVSVFNYKGGPDYRDLFSESPPDELIPPCSEAGVLGVLPGMVGSIQASEAIKVILGIGEVLSGRLLIIDALSVNTRLLSFGTNPKRERQVEKSNSSESGLMFHSVNTKDVLERMNNGWKPFVLDVRRDNEFQQAHLEIVNHQVPHKEVLSALEFLPDEGDVLVHCLAGMRSKMAIMFLIQAGIDSNRLYNLEGGISEWAVIDPQGIIHG